MEKFVKVPINRYIDLENSESLLIALEGAGVDNWPGYEEIELEEFTEKDIALTIIEG